MNSPATITEQGSVVQLLEMSPRYTKNAEAKLTGQVDNQSGKKINSRLLQPKN